MNEPTITYRPGSAEMAPDLPGLKAPYKYRMSIKATNTLVAELKEFVKRECFNPGRQLMQCDLVTTKPVKYGIKLNVWLLTHPVVASRDIGYDRDGTQGCSAEEWQGVVNRLTALLRAHLYGCAPYYNAYEEARKPQFSFETYIRYTEHDL